MRPSAVLGLVGACCILTVIFMLQGMQIALQMGVFDGRMSEALRTRYPAQPMLLVPCQNRGCDQEVQMLNITLRHDAH